MAQILYEKLRGYCLGLLKFLREFLRLSKRCAIDFARSAPVAAKNVEDRILYFVVKLGFVDTVMPDDTFAKRDGNSPIHSLREIRSEIAPIDERGLYVIDLFRLFDQVFHGLTGDICVFVFQQCFDDVHVPRADQRF